VLAALVLALLGVDEHQIAADYSLSGLGMVRMRAWLEETFPGAIDRMAQQPAAFMTAPVEAMERFLVAVDDRYGSIREYASTIGVTDDLVARMRDRLLE
jgi:hypothetical protein